MRKTLDWVEHHSRPRRTPPALSPQGLPYASFNRRMLAATLDTGLLMVLFMPFNQWLMAYAYQGMHIDPQAIQLAMDGAATPQEANLIALRMFLEGGGGAAFAWLAQMQCVAVVTLSFVCWHFWSATPGKLLLRMRIVDATTGERLRDWQAMARAIGYLASALPLMAGFFMLAWTKRRQALHDKIAGTVVVVTPWRAAAPPSDSPAPTPAE